MITLIKKLWARVQYEIILRTYLKKKSKDNEDPYIYK
jgi:hypothetical protein